MVAIPWLMALILLALTWMLAAQFRRRRRPYQLAWAVALAVGCAGSVAFALSAMSGGNADLFRAYYLGGAVLTAPLLGVGSTYLLGRPLWPRLLLAVTGLVTLAALWGLIVTPISPSGLRQLGIAPGTTLVHAPLTIVAVVVGNSLGTIAVVGVALASIWRALRAGAPAALAWGNAFIAAGTLCIAAAGSLARLGQGAGFWVTMTVGWCVVYGGVRATGAARRPSDPAAVEGGART